MPCPTWLKRTPRDTLSVPAERWDETAARDARQLVRAFRVNT